MFGRRKKSEKFSYETGTKGGQLAPIAHASPSRINKVLKSLDKHPPPMVPEEATEAAQEAITRALKSLDQDLPEDRVQGMMALAEWINNAFGAPAEALGYELRKESMEKPAPALVLMMKVLNEPGTHCGKPTGAQPLHRVMLMILSNLASDAFDKGSHDTKRLLERSNIFPRLVEFVYSEEDTISQIYACACLQNLCKDLAFARMLRAYDAVEELERLCDESPNDHVKRYAAGALFNCVEAIHQEVERNKLDEQAKAAKAEGMFTVEDAEKGTKVEVIDRLVNGRKVMWLANKPTEDFEGTLKIVEVEATNKDSGKPAVGDRVKLESGMEVDLTIIAARDLVAKDFKLFAKGSSDPYVTVYAVDRKGKRGKQLAKSPVIKQKLDPEWNFQTKLKLGLSERNPTVVLCIWDRDALSKDDPMGEVTIPVAEMLEQQLPAVQQWYKVEKTKNAPDAKGELHVQTTVSVAHMAFENYEKPGEDGEPPPKKKGKGVMSMLLSSGGDDEMNLPEHVLAQLAKREMDALAERTREKFATKIMQNYVRGWKARNAHKRFLAEMQARKAMQIAARFINSRAFRRRRDLLLTCTRMVQAQYRAAMAARYGLCSRRAAYLFIIVFRDMHEAVKLKHLTAEVNEFYKGRQQFWREEAAEKRAKKRTEEAKELREMMEEAERTGQAPPEGAVSKALAATTLGKTAEASSVTSRIPLYQRRLEEDGEDGAAAEEEEEGPPLSPRSTLRRQATALGAPMSRDGQTLQMGPTGLRRGPSSPALRPSFSQPLGRPILGSPSPGGGRNRSPTMARLPTQAGGLGQQLGLRAQPTGLSPITGGQLGFSSPQPRFGALQPAASQAALLRPPGGRPGAGR